jgi:hypothetical protein
MLLARGVPNKLETEEAILLKSDQLSSAAADLHWLAFLLTERRDLSVDIAVDALVDQDAARPYFASWMSAWSRRIVLAKALGAVREELVESADRTQRTSAKRWAAPPAEWSLSPATSKAQIEDALLAIDLFPRAAVVLLSFERVPMRDAVALLDADAELVAKAHVIGLRALTGNLARRQSYSAPMRSPMAAISFAILLAFTVLSAHAVEPEHSFAAGQRYYQEADFRKAASHFETICKTGDDAEACYWAGLSYERLADIATPFGCRTNAKARNYLRTAMNAAPGRYVYRQALFDHLLERADCSRAAFSEAADLLSAMPASDPDYPHMVRRLEVARRLHGAGEARLARIFLPIR